MLIFLNLYSLTLLAERDPTMYHIRVDSMYSRHRDCAFGVRVSARIWLIECTTKIQLLEITCSRCTLPIWAVAYQTCFSFSSIFACNAFSRAHLTACGKFNTENHLIDFHCFHGIHSMSNFAINVIAAKQ